MVLSYREVWFSGHGLTKDCIPLNMQVEASSNHTNLLCLPAKLRAHLPLKSNAIISESTEEQSDSSHSKFEDSAIQCDYIHSHSLGVMEGVVVHISPKANSARIAVLFR